MTPKNLFLLPLGILCFFCSHQLQAQSQADQEILIETVKSRLNSMATDDKGTLRQFCSKQNITGEFVFDITIKEKGDVLTVFMVSHNRDDIRQQNILKDKLHSLRFSNVKLAKNQRIKFRHSLQF